MDRIYNPKAHSFNTAKDNEKNKRNNKKNWGIFRILYNKKISFLNKKIAKKNFKKFRLVKEKCKKFKDKSIISKISSH